MGTENVLLSANKGRSVKRVVVTSSCGAIYTDAIDCRSAPNEMLTEDIWNTTASLEYQAYFYSKTLAEQKAWEINKAQSRWDLVTINPSLVMGPPLNPQAVTSASFDIVRQLCDGTMKMGAPKIGIGLVDVRDVAKVHFHAGFIPKAKGRYITSAHNTDFVELGTVLLPKYGKQFPLPKKALPKWLLMVIGPVANKLFTRKFIRNNVNIPWKADNSKIKEELGIDFRPMKSTMEDTLETLIKENALQSKK